MTFSTVFTVLSVIQAFITQGFGIYSIFKGTYKPQRMTRFLYFVMTLLMVGSLYVQQSWTALALAAAQGVGVTLVFLLSFKYGMGGAHKTDLITLFGALATGIVWKTTSNAVLALEMSVVTDLLAFFPTLLKTWSHPFTEDWRFYFSDVLASSFSLLAFVGTSFVLSDLVFPVYIFTLNASAATLIFFRQKAVG